MENTDSSMIEFIGLRVTKIECVESAEFSHPIYCVTYYDNHAKSVCAYGYNFRNAVAKAMSDFERN